VVDSPEQAVRILQLDLATLRALAAGDLVEAQRDVPARLTTYLVEPDSRHLWQMRVGQVADDPDSGAWVTGVVVDVRTGRVVGRAGFHGPPDDAGMVEVGYSTRPSGVAGMRRPRCGGCSRGPQRNPTSASCARR